MENKTMGNSRAQQFYKSLNMYRKFYKIKRSKQLAMFTMLMLVIPVIGIIGRSVTAEAADPEIVEDWGYTESEPAMSFPFITEELGYRRVETREGPHGDVMVSIDPSVVPYGSVLYIEGIGYRYNVPGYAADSIVIYFENGEDAIQWQNQEVRIYHIPSQGEMRFWYADSLVVEQFAYCECEACLPRHLGMPRGLSGNYLIGGVTCAVDTREIPLGSVLYVPNVGIVFAVDTAENGVGVFLNGHEDGVQFGRLEGEVLIIQ